MDVALTALARVAPTRGIWIPAVAGGRRLVALLTLITAIGGGTPTVFGQSARPAQSSLTATEIAGHRLTDAELEGFSRASRRLVTASRTGASGATRPLFTRDIVMLEDLAIAAATLEGRLAGNPALAAELARENVSPREYARFALSLIGARLAQGFLSAGVLKRVPAGVAADNVAFISRHQADVDTLLEELDVDWDPSGSK